MHVHSQTRPSTVCACLIMKTSACMSTVTQVSSTRFVQMFREKCQFLQVQRCTCGFTSTSEPFLLIEAAAAEELQNTLSHVACLSTMELQQLHGELMTSPFRSKARSRLFKALIDKEACSRARVMLGLQYLTR